MRAGKWTPALDGKSYKILRPCFPQGIYAFVFIVITEVTRVECFISRSVHGLSGMREKELFHSSSSFWQDYTS